MLYKDRDPELWYYGSNNVDGKPVSILTSRRGVRQGDPLSMALFCIAMAPVWDELLEVAGDGVLLAYADDGILSLPPTRVPAVNNRLDSILGKVGLSPVRSRKKTYVVWPLGTDVEAVWDLGLSDDETQAPRLAAHEGIIRCLGCPHHRSHDMAFVTEWLQPVEDRHDRLLELIAAMSDISPLSAMRLLQVSGVRRFQHVMRPLPPEVCHALLSRRDEAIATCKRKILQDDDELLSGALGTITNGPALLGGSNTASVAEERHAAHVACYGLVLGPLGNRLSACPAPSLASRGTHRRLAAELRSAATGESPWARALLQARADLASQVDFSGNAEWMPTHIDRLAPTRTSIETAGDRLGSPPPSREIDKCSIPEVAELASSDTGVKHLMGKVSFLVRAKLHCEAYEHLTPRKRTWSNSTAGRGSVAYLSMDTSPAHSAPPLVSRTAMRISQGLPGVSPSRHPNLSRCPTCGQEGTVEDTIKHIPRCANGGACHTAHRKLAAAVWDMMLEAGATKHDLAWELPGLRPGHADRPGDVVWKDFYGEGRHLVVDCCCTSVRRDEIEAQFDDPGCAVRAAEKRKFDNDDLSSRPVSTDGHVLVPFVVEDGGRFGDHALALLWNLALRGAGPGGSLTPRPGRLAPTTTATASWWAAKWVYLL